MKVKALEIYNAQSIDGMDWEDILQIVPMGNKAIVLVKDKEERRNDKERTYNSLIDTYQGEFNKRCKEALYDDFGGTENITFSYKESDTQYIDDIRIVCYKGGEKYVVALDLTKRPETYKYITFSREEDEL